MMQYFNFEFSFVLRGNRTGVLVEKNEIEFLGKLQFDGINGLILIPEGEREFAASIFKKINKEAIFVAEDTQEYRITQAGEELFSEIRRIIDVLRFYEVHPYIRPALTVDGLIFFDDNIVLIERGNEPFKGKLALPGGYVNYGEKVEDAFLREMREEIGREIKGMKLFTVVSEPGRDPRGHTVSIVFSGFIDDPPTAGDDAARVFLFSLGDAQELKMAFDHQKIIRSFARSNF